MSECFQSRGRLCAFAPLRLCETIRRISFANRRAFVVAMFATRCSLLVVVMFATRYSMLATRIVRVLCELCVKRIVNVGGVRHRVEKGGRCFKR